MNDIVSEITKSFVINNKHLEWRVSPCPSVPIGNRIRQRNVMFKSVLLSVRLVIFILVHGRLPVGTVKFADGDTRNLTAKNLVDALARMKP